MSTKSIAVAATLALFVAGFAHADGIKPIENQAIDLGTVTGDAYYTVQPDGYHVTATFGTAVPLRVQAVLSSGQAINVSTPRALGEQPITVNIRREDNRIVITQTPVTN
jgi:hypothetical protein